jgi:subtilisin family serine protease
MATPHVAAEAALVLSVAPDLTPSQTVSLIQAAVDPIRACLNPGRYYGSGRIDVPAALNQALLSHHESAGGAATDFALPFRLYLPAIPERSTCP